MQSIQSKASFLLAKRSYFSKELAKKLEDKGYPKKEIESLISELTKRGWLNDQELAKRFIQRQKEKGYGGKVIAWKLKEKGGEMGAFIEDSEEDIKSFLQKRYRKDLPEKKQKVIAALMRRGFSYDLINKTLHSICE